MNQSDRNRRKNKSLIDIQSSDKVHESINFRYASFALQFVCA